MKRPCSSTFTYYAVTFCFQVSWIIFSCYHLVHALCCLTLAYISVFHTSLKVYVFTESDNLINRGVSQGASEAVI